MLKLFLIANFLLLSHMSNSNTRLLAESIIEDTTPTTQKHTLSVKVLNDFYFVTFLMQIASLIGFSIKFSEI